MMAGKTARSEESLDTEVKLRTVDEALRHGVGLRDPRTLFLRGELVAGPDVEIDVNVVIEGTVVLGAGVRIGPNCILRDCGIAAGSEIRANSMVEDASIGPSCRVGPFARLRDGADLAEEVHLGSFIEVKNARFGARSRAKHFGFLGDVDIGSDVTIGAGTITCNHDGARRHRTMIGDGALIGSGSELVAPVTVGIGATVGAGSTIAEDVSPGELTLARVRQFLVSGWERPRAEDAARD